MICDVCHTRPVRPALGRGPKPRRCLPCKYAKTDGLRAKRDTDDARRYAQRLVREEIAVRNLPRDYCRCAIPAPRSEDALVTCLLCAREVWPA